jgi:hypothetical protein
MPVPARVIPVPGKNKKSLPPNAEESAAEVVPGVQFAGLAEAAHHLHRGGRGRSACAEEFGGLVLAKGMMLVVLASRAVFPAELPVLFGVFYNRFTGVKHAE